MPIDSNSIETSLQQATERANSIHVATQLMSRLAELLPEQWKPATAAE